MSHHPSVSVRPSAPDDFMDAARSCTAKRYGDEALFCGQPVPVGAPIDACGKHLTAAYAFCAQLIHGDPTWMDRMPNIARDRRGAMKDMDAVVYYAKIGDYIKIGTTQDFARRMSSLRVDRVLAVEPGSFALEAARHNQFATSQVLTGRGKEYFHPTGEIRDHIMLLAGISVE